MLQGLASLFIGQFAGSTIVPVITKIGVGFSAPIVFVFIRFLFASILFLPFFLLSKKQKLGKRDFVRFLICAAFLFVNVTFFTVGVQFTTAIMTQILYMIAPVVVVILSHWVLNEKLTKEKIIGLLVALTGVGFLLYQSFAKEEALSLGTFLGNSIVMVGVLGYAGWILYSRYLANSKKYTSYEMTFFTFAFIAFYLLFLLPFQQILAPSKIKFITTTGMVDALIVAFGSIILYYFFQLGIKKTNAFTASMFQYMGPFFTAFISIPLLGEKPTLNLFIGGALIILGVFYATTFLYLKKKILRDKIKI